MTSPSVRSRAVANRPAPRRGGPSASRRWLRRALPWLPAAAFALGALPTAASAQDRTIPPPATINTEEATAQDTLVAGGAVTVENGGWLKAEDFVTGENVTIDAGGLLTTQNTGTPGGAFTGNGNYTVTGGATSISGELFVGSTRDLSGNPNVPGPPLTGVDGPVGTLAVSAGSVTAEAGGSITAAALALTGNGDAFTDGIGATTTITGATTVDAGGIPSAVGLNVSNGGAFNGSTLAVTDRGTAFSYDAGSTITFSGTATVDNGRLNAFSGSAVEGTTLALTNGGGSFSDGAGSTFTLSGAATVDGTAGLTDSILSAQNGGAVEGTTLALTNDGDGLVTGAGSTFTLSGAATVSGVGSDLYARNGGAFDGTTLALTGGGDAGAVDAGSTLTLSGAATVDGAGSTLTAQNGGALTADSATQTGGLIDVRTGSTMTFTNDVTVDGGESRVNGTLAAADLLLNQDGLLTGAGTIVGDLTASGTIAVGNSPGVLNVAGNYVGNGQTFDVEVQGAAAPVAGVDYDQLAVAGTAVVDGGTVNVLPFGGQNYTVGARYEFLTAAGGLTVVNRVAVNDTVANARFAQLIGPNFYALVVARAGSQDFARTFNQRAVAGGLAAAAGDPALAPLRDALDTLADENAVRAAFDGLSGEIYGTQLTALNRSSLQFLDVVGRGGAFPLVCGTCGVDRPGRAGTQGWLETYGAGGQIDSDGNAAEADLGAAGLAVGLSQVFGGSGGCVAVDAFYGYESLTTRAPAVRSSVTDEIHRVGGSVRASAGNAYGRLTGFAGSTDGEARRAFAIDNPLFPLSDSTRADLDGSLAAGDAEAGLLYGTPGAYVSPVVGLRYVQVDRDGFTECGGITALTVEDSSLEELRARIGLRAGRQVALVAGLPTTGTFEAFYSRDLLAGTVGDYRAAFAAAPASAFEARGTDFGADRVTLAPGLSIGDGPVRLSGQYRAGLSEQAVLHSGDVRLEVCF